MVDFENGLFVTSALRATSAPENLEDFSLQLLVIVLIPRKRTLLRSPRPHVLPHVFPVLLLLFFGFHEEILTDCLDVKKEIWLRC